MELTGGYPFWLIKDGLPYSYPSLEKSIHTDVVIIGGGISGALAGYHLLNAGVDCIIVDSRTIGLGSTCASTSLLQYEIDTPLSKLKNMVGLKNAVDSYKLCERAINTIGEIDKKIGCNEFEFKPSLYYAAGENHISRLHREFLIRKQHGFNVKYLEKKAVDKMFGFDSPGAILSESGAQTNAYKFTHALHQFSIKNGGKVYDRTAVVDIQCRPHAVLLKTNNGHTIKAKKIIHATGYEVVNYIDKKIVDLNSTYAIISEQNAAGTKFWKDEALIWNTADPYLYLRTTKDRRIIAGGRDECFNDAAKRDILIGKKTKQLKKDFEKLFPAITFKQEFAWTGTFGSTKDGLPFIGSIPGKPDSYFALGFGGNGITFSLIAAEMITEMITKGKSRYADIFSFNRINN